MKKLVFLLLLLTLCLGLAACAASDPTPAPTPSEKAQAPEETPEPSDDGLPDIDPNSWQFVLVNPWNEISGDAPALENFEGVPFDARIIGSLSDFAQGARDAGYSFRAFSGYRDYATQAYLYNRKVEQVGEAKARTIVAYPGTSEHQLGLAVDIIDYYYTNLDAEQENTPTQQWLMENSWRYGFILRYPNGSSDITGIIYEPWHYRYVGLDAAKEIYDLGVTLEEYLDMFYEPID